MAHLDHIGISVADAEAVAALYEQLLGHAPYKTETVEDEGVRTHFIEAGTAKLELLEALGPDSPIARALDKRGPGLHHLAFEVEDIQATYARMQELGYTPLSEAPTSGADGKLIFFLHPKQTHGVLVEFCQSVVYTPARLSLPYADGAVEMERYGAPDGPLLLLLGAKEATVRALARYLAATMQVCVMPAAPSAAEAARQVGALLDHANGHTVSVWGQGSQSAAVLHVAQVHADGITSYLLDTPAPVAIVPPLAQPGLLLAGDAAPEKALEATLNLHRSLAHTHLAVLPLTAEPAQDAADAYASLIRQHIAALTP